MAISACDQQAVVIQLMRKFMLFNSYEFIFLFLPITLLVFFSIGGRGHHRIAIAWLVGASLFFYGWWNPAYLGLILASILFNYAVGLALLSQPRIASHRIASHRIAQNFTPFRYLCQPFFIRLF